MIELENQDLEILSQLARERSSDEIHYQEVKQILIDGFSKFADQELIDFFGSREKLFARRVDWLLENYSYAGQDSATVFSSDSGRKNILRIVRSCGVPVKDIEDLVQDIVFKFWRHHHAEKYNPLKAPWSHHVRHSVKTCVNNFWAKRDRTPTDKGFPFQQYSPPTDSDQLEIEPYSLEQDPTPDQKMVLEEFYREWEDYISLEKSFRTGVYRGYRELCTLIPPGVPQIPTLVPMNLYVVAKGKKNFRVTIPEWVSMNQSILVPVERLSPYPVEGSLDTSTLRSFPNPEFRDGQEAQRYERTPLDVYHLLERGYQVDEIARELKIGPSTAHNWVRQIQEVFRRFWLTSNLIPESAKYLAVPTYYCSKCHKIMHSFHESGCVKCGISMVGWEKIIRLDAYPWPQVRGTKNISDRAAKYKQSMTIQRCSI